MPLGAISRIQFTCWVDKHRRVKMPTVARFDQVGAYKLNIKDACWKSQSFPSKPALPVGFLSHGERNGPVAGTKFAIARSAADAANHPKL